MSFETFNHSIAHTIQLYIYMAQFPLFFSPLASPPFVSPSTYLAPSSCDRNRPPRSQVACKLTPFVPPFTQLSYPLQNPKPQLPSAKQRRPREYSGSCYPEHYGNLRKKVFDMKITFFDEIFFILFYSTMSTVYTVNTFKFSDAIVYRDESRLGLPRAAFKLKRFSLRYWIT